MSVIISAEQFGHLTRAGLEPTLGVKLIGVIKIDAG
jgi:hypothetical protein